MKAIVYHSYGSPDVLRLAEVGRPTPREGEVLIKVRATSVNVVRVGPCIVHECRGQMSGQVLILGASHTLLAVLSREVSHSGCCSIGSVADTRTLNWLV